MFRIRDFENGLICGATVGIGLACACYGLYNHWDDSMGAGFILLVAGVLAVLISLDYYSEN